MHDADVAVFRWINGWNDAYSPFYVFLSEGSKWTWVRILLALVFVAMIAAGPRSRKAAILALIAFPVANGLTDILKHSFHVLRPCVELVDVHLRVGKLDSFGTASAHSANTAAVATVLTWFLRPWGSIPIAVALFTGLSRIYVGVHYPSQVLLGWACGILVGFLVVGVYWLIVRRGAVEAHANEEPHEPAQDLGF